MKQNPRKVPGSVKPLWLHGFIEYMTAKTFFKRTRLRAHKSRVVSSFCLSDWSHQSPNINIIEVLWSDLKATVTKCGPANIKELVRTNVHR